MTLPKEFARGRLEALLRGLGESYPLTPPERRRIVLGVLAALKELGLTLDEDYVLGKDA